MYDMAAYYEAASVQDAIALRLAHPEAQLIAGGTDVLVQMREGKRAGKALISIHDIEELNHITLEADGTLSIGALSSFTTITNDPLIQAHCSTLGQAVDLVGGPQIRNAGTIGGNLGTGVTSADSAATLFAWDAVIELTGQNGKRLVPIPQFYLGPGKVDIHPDELITAVRIPRAAYEGYEGHYIKYAMREAMDIATLACSANVKLSEDKKTFCDLRIAYGVAGPVPIRAHTAEDAFRGKAVTAETVAAFAKAALGDLHPRDSRRASKAFRLHIAEELAKRCITESVVLAGGAI